MYLCYACNTSIFLESVVHGVKLCMLFMEWWWNDIPTFQVFIVTGYEKFGVKCCWYAGYIAALVACFLCSVSEIRKVFIWWYVWNHVSTFQVFMIIGHEKFGVKCCGYVAFVAATHFCDGIALSPLLRPLFLVTLWLPAFGGDNPVGQVEAP